EPRLRFHHNDHNLGSFLTEKGCDNTRKVLRRRGWVFPPLRDCRAAWEEKYPNWQWRNPDLAEWQVEADDLAEIEETSGAKEQAFKDAVRQLKDEDDAKAAAHVDAGVIIPRSAV
ncbi:MAG: hypothetical protein ACJ8DV_02390, partial [Microvirga sp.]